MASVPTQAVQPDCWSAQLGRAGSSRAADGDAGGTSESGQEAAGKLHGPGCGDPRQGHVSQTGEALEEARAQRALEVFTKRSQAQEDIRGAVDGSHLFAGHAVRLLHGATTMEGRNGLYGVDAAQ